MLRYIKVNNEWIDTLMEQKEWGRYFYIIEGIIWYFSGEDGVDYKVGELQEESDEKVSATAI